MWVMTFDQVDMYLTLRRMSEIYVLELFNMHNWALVVTVGSFRYILMIERRAIFKS